MKKLGYLLLAAAVLAGIFYFTNKNKTTAVYDRDTTIDGPFLVKAEDRIVIKNNAVLTVKGAVDIAGEIAGEDGSNVTIVAEDGFVLTGVMATSGNLQIVTKPELVAKTDEDIAKVFDEAGSDSGKGPRLGPIADESGSAAVSQSLVFGSKQSRHIIFGVPKAKAHEGEDVVVSGRIKVGQPRPGQRQIVLLNVPNAGKITLKDLSIEGPKGTGGNSDMNQSCDARGANGSDAMRFLAMAPNLRIDDFTLKLGDGGNGGDAETKTDCDPSSTATGGRGGSAGNFKMMAAENFEIAGAFTIVPGRGGDGGMATAHGKDGDPGQKGADADARGGDGADNQKKLGLDGTVGGMANVQIGSIYGGKGGQARVNPGTGGDGEGCGKNGGDGGKGTATGGKGGKAGVSLSGGAARSAGAEDVGGDGGDVNGIGAAGGHGGNCDSKGPGGHGGKGGDAKSTPGRGGAAATRNGADGKVIFERGGNGGDGGDGCGEGQGGKGGSGAQQGADGTNGKNLCTGKKVQAINYSGKYLPVDQLIVESEQGCDGGQPHWHATSGMVTATDGSKVSDPGPQCGYGKVSERPIVEVEIKL